MSGEMGVQRGSTNPLVVAIDGPGGVGKTTVARALARRLQLPHLDTGAFYRAATLVVLRQGIDPTDVAAVVDAVAASDISYDDGVLLLNGTDESKAIRSPEVTAAVSEIAAIRGVRSVLVDRQRAWVEEKGGSAIVEGRDIGSVVFTDAASKIFLTARPEIRAERRAGDTETEVAEVSAVEHDLRRRDEADSNREVSPLRPADDAQIIDTSNLTLTQVIERAVWLVTSGSSRG